MKSIFKMPKDLKVAVVCSSNQNRSMEAHAFLSKKGFKVRSFGSGNQVKLPGPAPDKPNIYDFSTSYEHMYQDLLAKDRAFYTQNGLLHMLDRNRRIKTHPERFQACHERFDVVFTAEERVYDQVIEGKLALFLEEEFQTANISHYLANTVFHGEHNALEQVFYRVLNEMHSILFCMWAGQELSCRTPVENLPVHIINIDIQDNHEEATIGAFLICEMAVMMSDSEDLDNDMDELIQIFETKAQRPVLHTVQFY